MVAAIGDGAILKRIDTRFTLHQMRRGITDPTQLATIDAALSNPEALDQIGSDVFDSVQAEATAGTIVPGGFLAWIMANLPAILAMIAQIMALFPKA
jgi:hypothetical protein